VHLSFVTPLLLNAGQTSNYLPYSDQEAELCMMEMSTTGAIVHLWFQTLGFVVSHFTCKQANCCPCFAATELTLRLATWVLFLLPMFCSHRGVLADEAENIATAHDDVLLAKILDKEECEALKMGEYLGVAAASSNPPKFIHFRYTPPSGNVKTKLAIV